MNIIFGQKLSLNYIDYQQINRNVSSEMFYSIMRVLYEKIPCTKNFFRLKTIYKDKLNF